MAESRVTQVRSRVSTKSDQKAIVYEIDDSAKLVRVTRVRHRQDVYRD